MILISVWLLSAVFTFIYACLVTLFPQRLPSILMKKAVESLLSIANGNEPEEEADLVEEGEVLINTFEN